MSAANAAKVKMYRIPYLNTCKSTLRTEIRQIKSRQLTIHRRCLFCFVENRGARICFEGRNQTDFTLISDGTEIMDKGPLTEHCSMQTIGERHQKRRRHDEQQEVSKQEVGAPKRHLDYLDYELSSRKVHCLAAQPSVVPLARPPGPVSLLVRQFSRKEDGDEDLLDGALNGNDCNQSKYRMRRVPEFQEPL